MTRRAGTLRRRLMLALALFTGGVALVFGLFAVTFMYAVEDTFLEATLKQEAAAQQRHRADTGAWAEPREPWIRLHERVEDFPADLQDARRDEPWRSEYAGRDGRHYHTLALPSADGTHDAWLVAEVSSQLVVRPMRDEVLVLLSITTLLLVGLALAVAAWLARRTAGPLATLAHVVETMDPADPPRHLGKGFRDDEVGVLASGLESLADRLRAFVAREREFTRDVSHELRTPLAVIRSASERLLAREGLDAETRASAHHLQQSAMQLQGTIDLMLSLAREDTPAAATEPVRVLPMIERVIVDQGPLADGRELDVDLQVPPQTRTALPESVLRSLLSNLVGNAIAHSIDGRVRIDLADGCLRIANAVAPDAALPAAGQRRDGSPGLGLGLGIVSRLCERHGIALTLVRDGDDVVARFPLPPP